MSEHNHPSRSSSSISIGTHDVPVSAPHRGERQESLTKGELAERRAPWSRWNPTKEQTESLQDLYHTQGIRSPNAEEIKKIVERLKQFGNVREKNVFYWFQNFHARQKQRCRLQEALTGLLSPPIQLLDRRRSWVRPNAPPILESGSMAPAHDKRPLLLPTWFPRKAAKVGESAEAGVNCVRVQAYTDAECAMGNSQVLFEKADGDPEGAVYQGCQTRIRREDGWLFSTGVAVECPTPQTLVLFPLHPEGLALKTPN